MSDCPFCQRITAGLFIDKLTELAFGSAVAVFGPLNPVTPGHLLVVPRTHFASAAESPADAGIAVMVAAQIAADLGGDYNIITSIGPAATQTVRHLHVHLVPRHDGDGLMLPWTGQHTAAAKPDGRG